MKKILHQSLKSVILAFVLVFPSFFLTTFANFFDFPKTILLVATVILTLILWGFVLMLDGKFSLNSGKFDLPLFLFVVAYLASGLIQTPNKMEAFVFPGNVTVMVGGFIIYLLTKIAFGSNKQSVALSLYFSGVLVALLSIFAFTGLFEAIPQLPAFIKDASFSPLGGKLPEIIFLIILLPIGLAQTMQESDKTKKAFYFLAGLIIILSTVLSATLIMPGKPGTPVIVDYQTSWSVAVDTLKASPILGAGPGNYLTAFSRFLPISYNTTPLWANRFLTGSSFLFTLVTEVGIIGFALFALAVYVMIKKSFANIKSVTGNLNAKDLGHSLSLLMLVTSFVFLPANMVLVISFFLIAYLNSDDSNTSINLTTTGFKNGNPTVSKFPSVVLGLFLIALGIILGFFSFKAVAAERKYKIAIDAIIRNDAKSAYDALTQAMTLNTYVDRYHATSDQLNLALARSIVQKEELTDADRSTVAQLIQQAIAEGKATVALNPQRSANWETLARTYQAIIPFAQGADNFAVTSFQQAITLDPINPNLRISLGGIYYALGMYDDAITAFSLAVTAKPDLANAHYNLAIAYREKGDVDKAINEMNIVLSLVQTGSDDYALAQKTLDELKLARPVPVVESTENLVPPPSQEEPVLNPPLDLPQEATPPATQE